MLRSYTDESGHSGDSRFVCMGGCITTVEVWSHFEEEWKRALNDAGVSCFHMTEFESSRGEFKKWKNKPDEHKLFLAKLLSIMDAHTMIYLAATEPVHKIAGKLAYKDDPYLDCLVGIIDSAALYVGSLDANEKIEMVFADHPEHTRRVRTIFPEIRDAVGGMYQRLGPDAYGSPKDIIPLQAADLVAFEVRKERERMQLRQDDQPRWPLTQLLKKPFYWNGSLRPIGAAPRRQSQ